MTTVQPGLLLVKPQTARLSRDVESFGKMDPYCYIQCGQSTGYTQQHQNGGKIPTWNDTLTFNIVDQYILNVEVRDKGNSGQLIGETSVTLMEIYQTAKISKSFALSYKGQQAGTLTMDFQFYPESVYHINSAPQVNLPPPSIMKIQGSAPPINPYSNATNLMNYNNNPYAPQQAPPAPSYVSPQINPYTNSNPYPQNNYYPPQNTNPINPYAPTSNQYIPQQNNYNPVAPPSSNYNNIPNNYYQAPPPQPQSNYIPQNNNYYAPPPQPPPTQPVYNQPQNNYYQNPPQNNYNYNNNYPKY